MHDLHEQICRGLQVRAVRYQSADRHVQVSATYEQGRNLRYDEVYHANSRARWRKAPSTLQGPVGERQREISSTAMAREDRLPAQEEAQLTTVSKNMSVNLPTEA